MPSAASPRRAWTIVLLLFFFMVVNFMDKMVLGLAGADIRDDLGLTDSEFGAVGSSFFLLFSLSGAAIALFADRFPARRLLAVLVLVWSVSQLVVALPVAGFLTLVLTRVTLGAAEGPAFPLANNTVFGWFPDKERTLPSSVLTVGGAAGVAVGAPVLAVLIGQFGWRAAFAFTGLLGLVWIAFWLRLGAEGPYAARSLKDAGGGPAVPYRRLLTCGSVLGGLAAGFAVFWMLAVAMTWLPQFLQRVHGYELERAGIVAAGVQVFGITFILGLGALSQRLLRRGVPSRVARGALGGAAVVVSGTAMLGLTRVGGGFAIILVMLVAFTIANAFQGLGQAALAELAPVRQRAGLLGVVVALASSAGAFGPAVTGAIIEGAASDAAGFRVAFDVVAVMMIVGGLLAALLIRPGRDAAALGVAAERPVAARP
ncbi:MFS transporter [Actinomadura flavalba]|uniref:MFS transporter n=1 Tax=Actinomadura flavalba TaxID=1120938 RepID=UPI0003623AB0|nr:MFS transporter [Actinomadura flavalba]